MKRAVGYCINQECEDTGKGAFLLNTLVFNCHRCGHPGKAVPETGRTKNQDRTFKEVQVHYDYDPSDDRFATIAIVRDENLWGSHNTYHYFTPMVQTEKRALVLAERILGVLNQHRFDQPLPDFEEVPKTTEKLLNWDVDLETFAEHCNQWGESMKGSPLTTL